MANEMLTFEEWPKIPRLNREMVVTEKIDGTNASILIADNGEPFVTGSGREIPFLCGSRTRWVFPENDNYGFARWAYENAEGLKKLGPGHHFGEWWGQGIQRKYDMKEKVFSLFNVGRWDGKIPEGCPVRTVPLLHSGPFMQETINTLLKFLAEGGSQAAPGFKDPEGLVIYHTALRGMFKVTIKGDEKGKGE